MKLLIFGNGYSGGAVALAARKAGAQVSITSRSPAAKPLPGIELVDFFQAEPAIAQATHVLVTAAPDDNGDPVLARYQPALRAAPHLGWLGYLSTTGVYGNRNGGWVDEATPPCPQSLRAERRVAAEQGWAQFGGMGVDIFRLAGIYGPGRSMFDDLRAGVARHVVKPGHLFGRIHRDDIAHGVMAALSRPAATGVNIFNFVDDEPAASADVVVQAARLLGVEPPPAVPFGEAEPLMSPMARSFWAENRKVSAARTKQALGLAWKYPTYREGLRAILAEESLQRGFQPGEVLRP